jgi:hypothetical protein
MGFSILVSKTYEIYFEFRNSLGFRRVRVENVRIFFVALFNVTAQVSGSGDETMSPGPG